MHPRSLLLMAILTAPLVGCGSNGNKGPGTTCGAGTMLENGMCIGSAGVTCGSNTTLMDGMCVGAPPGTSTTCGPGTTLQNGTCVVDLTAPPPVTGLTATASGTTVSVSWTASNGAAGYVVARLVAGAYDAPAQLTTYTTGQMLPAGATVIAAGSATTATDTVTAPGRYAYMVWPVSASTVYGFSREAATVVTVPAQTGALSIDVANAAATVTTQPANVALATGNVTYDAATSTLTFDLTATQNTGGHLFNVKAIFGAPSSGEVTASGTDDAGDSFVQLAVGAVLPGTDAKSTITLTGVGATDTVTLPVTIAESSIGQVGANLVDLAGGTGAFMQLPGLRGRGQVASVFTDGVFDASGRYYYGVTRWTPGVYRLDVATGDATAVPLLGTVAEGACLVVGDDGFGYAVFGRNAHRRGTADALVFAKLDLASLSPIAITTLIPPAGGVAHGCALHGTTLAMGWGDAVYLADTTTMSVTDADTTTADVIDPVVLGAGSDVQRLVFSPDGATIYVSERQSSNIEAIDLATLTASPYHTAADRVQGLTIDAAGTLWWGAPGTEGVAGVSTTGGLVSFDGTTETPVPNLAEPIAAIGPWSGTTVMVAAQNGDVFSVDVTTGSTAHQGTINATHLGHGFAAYLTP